MPHTPFDYPRKRVSKAESESQLDRWGQLAQDGSRVDPTLYPEYDVKRGLRDVTGKGVLAGLTRIGDVVGSTPVGSNLAPAAGQLIYRGIDINKLVDGFVAEDRLGYEETCYLLLFGDLPTAAELLEFEYHLATNRTLPRAFVHDAILSLPSRDIMNAMSRSVLALYTLDKNPDDTSVRNILRQSLHLISKFPMLAVYAYQAHLDEFQGRGLVIHRPLPELSAAENFLHMLRPNSKFTPLEARVLDMTLVLQAEHGGGNNSSFTSHVVSSTHTDTYATIAAALGSLKGPRHGGANLKVIGMFQDMRSSVRDLKDDDQVVSYLERVLAKEAYDRSGLIYGMGHPVYSVSDPRTLILRRYAEQLAEEKGRSEEYEFYERVERIAPEVIGKKRSVYKGVSANVDFYSGLVYDMLGIPRELFTPLFAISRVVGWSAHRIEELANGGKIVRPAYKNVAPRRQYVPLDARDI
ncbi:MAG: citrate/2-methylcitrate synthase [Actinomycetota bacterium]|nr:citrate/2-methylcitrate synthase [Actinomycetota bacterium]